METASGFGGRYLFWLAALVLCTGCGERGGADGGGDPPAHAAAAEVPDACTFIDRDQLAEMVGYELRDGEPEETPPGSSSCEFETPPLMYVTRTFPDPALPASVGFSSVIINIYTADPANFAEFRELLGPDGEDVPGIGDGAYFYGPDMLYVLVGNRGLSVRMYASPESPEDEARVREVMLSLARLGAAKLG